MTGKSMDQSSTRDFLQASLAEGDHKILETLGVKRTEPHTECHNAPAPVTGKPRGL